MKGNGFVGAVWLDGSDAKKIHHMLFVCVHALRSSIALKWLESQGHPKDRIIIKPFLCNLLVAHLTLELS